MAELPGLLERAAADHPLLLREELERQFHACALVRPFRRAAYDPGQRLEYTVTGVAPAHTGRMVVQVERFVGGGFAGQVYRVRLLEVQSDDGPLVGLTVDKHYALKILKPPSKFACAFRDFLYFLAYQGPFSAQVNPAAVRVGVLWQKLVRQAAAHRFGRPDAVCDTYATFYDADLHSFGEINEWIDGRIWKFEVDDRLFERWDFDLPPPADHPSAEYVSKKQFMGELVALLHEMGAPELSRQYAWWTCKSQPNALKRLDAEDAPGAGLTAIDFRAGLALLPFLPMSPADFGLILRGLVRGRLVQFDRSDPASLGRFVEARPEHFADLQTAVHELCEQEPVYRASLPDVTHHHVRLVTDARLRRSIRNGTITGWRHLGRLDEEHAARLTRRPGLFVLLFVLSLIPLLGRSVVKLWGNARTRAHVKRCLSGFGYLWRALRGARIETLVVWHRHGRSGDRRTLRLVDQPVRYWLQRVLLGWWPATWHRFVMEPSFAWAQMRAAVGFLVRFLRVPSFREEWLLEQVRLGREEGMLTHSEADKITHQIKDPYIQKYLRCLAVHLCTLPISELTVLVSGTVVGAYFLIRGRSWTEALTYAAAVVAVVQMFPVSPGSLIRGAFVLYLMVREWDIRSYYIAAPVAFLRGVGYLAFPFQMVAHDPALARFLAGRWARNAVHIVPIFGESGALLEHAVFDLFFNLPLSVKRGFRTRPLRWSIGTALATAALAVVAFLGFARVWEWRQPREQLEAVQAVSVVPYHGPAGGRLHWSWRGMRVHFEGRDPPVDYPANVWDGSVTEGATVDAVIRRSFFGNEYDGLRITKRASLPGAEAVPTTQYSP
ncbi:MAG: hypothetical protein V2A79_16330 [Planctomycetota bacterium]